MSPREARLVNCYNVCTDRESAGVTGEDMRGVWQLLYSCCGSLLLTGVLLAIGTLVLAGEPMNAPRQSPISESDVSPHSRPLTHAQLLDEYLARLQEQLKLETRSIEESGLVEVKLTIRKDGSVTFAEIVVLDGPADPAQRPSTLGKPTRAVPTAADRGRYPHREHAAALAVPWPRPLGLHRPGPLSGSIVTRRGGSIQACIGGWLYATVGPRL